MHAAAAAGRPSWCVAAAGRVVLAEVRAAAAAAAPAGRCHAPGRPDRAPVADRVCRRRSGVLRANRGPRRHARVRVVPARRRRDGMCRRGSRCGVGGRAALGPLVPVAPCPGASAGSSLTPSFVADADGLFLLHFPHLLFRYASLFKTENGMATRS
ncbi:hypothetical protein VPH35_027828 [Triticum aestivum]